MRLTQTNARRALSLFVLTAVAFTIGVNIPISTRAAEATNEVDVDGLECRLAYETNRISEFNAPLEPTYFYGVFQAQRAAPTVVNSLLQFSPFSADPQYLINPNLGTATIGPSVTKFVTSTDTVDEQYAFNFDRKNLRLTTYQKRLPNYVVGDYTSFIFRTQPKWPEVNGDIDDAALGDMPTMTFDGSAVYIMVFGCRKLDPTILRRIARAHGQQSR